MTRTVVPVTLAIFLAGIGCLHFVWIFTPWPFADAATFSKVIGGVDSNELPPALPTALIGMALVGGGVLTLMVNGNIPRIGPAWLLTLGVYGLCGVLLLRGLGGYLMNSGNASEFQKWNSVLYSPLCIGLGILAGVVAVAATQRR